MSGRGGEQQRLVSLGLHKYTQYLGGVDGYKVGGAGEQVVRLGGRVSRGRVHRHQVVTTSAQRERYTPHVYCSHLHTPHL